MKNDQPMSKDDIAEGFATIAAPVIAERGKAPIRAGKGRLRPIFTVAPSGEVTGVVPHAAVVQGLLVKQGVADATVDGVRPERVKRLDCPALVNVKKNVTPKRCPPCAKAHEKARNRERTNAFRLANPEIWKARSAAWKRANPERVLEMQRESRAKSERQKTTRRAWETKNKAKRDAEASEKRKKTREACRLRSKAWRDKKAAERRTAEVTP